MRSLLHACSNGLSFVSSLWVLTVAGASFMLRIFLNAECSLLALQVLLVVPYSGYWYYQLSSMSRSEMSSNPFAFPPSMLGLKISRIDAAGFILNFEQV